MKTIILLMLLLYCSVALAHKDLNSIYSHEHTGKFKTRSCLVQVVKNHIPKEWDDETKESGTFEVENNGKVWAYSYISEWEEEKGLTVKHSWFKDSQLMNKVVRDMSLGKMMYSYQTMKPWKEGKWQTITRDIHGNPMNRISFKITRVDGKYLVTSDKENFYCSEVRAPVTEVVEEIVEKKQQKKDYSKYYKFELSPVYYYQSDSFEYTTFKFSWTPRIYDINEKTSFKVRASFTPLEYEGGTKFIGYGADIIGAYELTDTFSSEVFAGMENWEGESGIIRYGLGGYSSIFAEYLPYLESWGLTYWKLNSEQLDTSVYALELKIGF